MVTNAWTNERLARAGLCALQARMGSTPITGSQGLSEHSAIPLWQALKGVDNTYSDNLYLRDYTQAYAGDQIRHAAEQINPEKIAQATDAKGLRFLMPGDTEWPVSLNDLDHLNRDIQAPGDMPPGLWVSGAGDLAQLSEMSVAVIGSRTATAYGEAAARRLAEGLASQGTTVVSGGSFGIAAASHRGALCAEGGTTIAVMPCGADVSYPQALDSLLDNIRERGVVVSEMPPGTYAYKTVADMRQRLIAAMSQGTVVVEASSQSASLQTASWASVLHRPVMAVPGPLTSAMSEGPHALLRSGTAELVRDEFDVSQVLAERPDPEDDFGQVVSIGQPAIVMQPSQNGLSIDLVR